jgi:hypothetical protein
VLRALTQGEELITEFFLSPDPDPQPAMAALKQHRKRTQPRFVLPAAKAA